MYWCKYITTVLNKRISDWSELLEGKYTYNVLLESKIKCAITMHAVIVSLFDYITNKCVSFG